MPDLYVDVDAAVTVPVNVLPLLDDTDFKSRETGVAYNAAGMDLVWNFVTAAGAVSQTAVTPTTSGDYDWSHVGDGMYKIEIPASGGGSINNDTEGVGWFTGIATGVLPWRGPFICFRAAGLNDALIENAYSTTRGLAGTALPNAAAEAAGGLYTRGSGAGQINQNANGQVDARLVAESLSLITKVDAIDDFVDTEIAAILAAVDTEVAAIKAKTDNLPATPAATGDAMTLTSGERNAVADALLARNINGGSSTGRTVKEALKRLRNRVAIAAGTATVYEADDTTPSWTAAVTTTAGDPVSEVNPT